MVGKRKLILVLIYQRSRHNGRFFLKDLVTAAVLISFLKNDAGNLVHVEYYYLWFTSAGWLSWMRSVYWLLFFDFANKEGNIIRALQ